MIVKIILLSLLVLVLQHAFTIVHFFGFLKTIYTHYPGECRQIPGIDIGAEDFHTLDNGLTFITTGFRFEKHSEEAEKYFKEANRKGRIYLFDFNHPEKNVVELTITSTKVFNRESFNAHGLSVWEDKENNRVFLFVVSHRPGQTDTVEKFLYVADKQRLQHVKTYEGSGTFKIINDLAATGENSFYVTNYLCWTSPSLSLVQFFLLLRCSDVVYYDGSTYQSVASRIGGANGISLSNDKKFVYVSAMLEKEVKVFRRESNGALTLAQSWPVGTVIDNFAVHPETGDIYCAGHPILHKMIAHDQNPRVNRAPSQVLQLKVKGENLTSVQELFVDATGDLISGSSVALVYKRKLLIGSVMHKLVLCDVNIPL